MSKRNQKGAITTAAIVSVVMSVFFVFSLVIALVFFMGKSDLQKTLDTRVDAQVAIEAKKIATQKDAELAEKEKSPTKTYTGPSAAGTVSFAYPKTYSAYVGESASGTTVVDGFFHPNIVPKENSTIQYALRMQVVGNSYESELSSFAASLKSGDAKATAFRAANVPSVLGTRIEGELRSDKEGVLILLPIRDKTLKIWTENKETIPDFETFVVPSINFVP